MTTDLAPSVVGARRGRTRRWRSAVFAPVGDGSTRRRASDAVRLGLAAVLVAGSVVLIRQGLAIEKDLVDAVTPQPAGVQWILSSLWFLGSIGATLVVIALALLARRFRLARDLAVAGAATWAMCGLLGLVLGSDGGRPATTGLDGIDLGFPLARLAVAVAVVSIVAPSLSRSCRWVVQAFVVLAAVAAVLRGSGLPLDVLATLALGWGMAAAVRLIFGSPTGLPAAADVIEAGQELGVELGEVEPVRPQVWGVARFSATTAGAPADVSLYGRDAADAQLLAKVWRFLWYRDSGPTLSLTRLQQVEHEAYLSFAAARVGVRAPDVLVAAEASSGDEAVLVTRPPAGRPLAELEPEAITDDLLRAVVDQVGRLRQAGIAHGLLSAETIVVGDAGEVGLREFRAATSSATDERLDRDLGGLLIVLALRSDPTRATAALLAGLGADAVVAALPQIQAAAVDRPTRHEVRSHKKFLGEVRDAGAAAAGVESPKLAEIHRVSLSSLLMALGALLGVFLLAQELAGVGDIWATLQTAEWGWVFACFVAAQLTNVTQAWSVMGSVSTPLPFGPTLALELANAFTGLVGGTVGTTATISRYFQKRGLAVSIAVSSGVLVSLAGMICQAILFIVALFLTHGAYDFGTDSSGSSSGSSINGTLILAAILLVGALIGVLTAVPRFRKMAIAKLKPQVTAARDNLTQLATQPGKLVQLFGGAAGAQILFAIALGFSLKAYGTSLPIGELIVINTIASLLGGIAPVPGGMGVIEAGLIAGLTAAGVPDTIAVAATITQRMFTCYLPPIWGYPTLAWMRKHEYL